MFQVLHLDMLSQCSIRVCLICLNNNVAIGKQTTTVTEQNTGSIINAIANNWGGGDDRVSLTWGYNNPPNEVKTKPKHQPPEGKIRYIFHNMAIHALVDTHG